MALLKIRKMPIEDLGRTALVTKVYLHVKNEYDFRHH